MVGADVAASALALLLLQAVRIQVSWAEEVGECSQQQVAEPQPQTQVAYAVAAPASPVVMPCMGYSQYGYGTYSPYGYSYPYSYPTAQAYGSVQGYYSPPHQGQQQQQEQRFAPPPPPPPPAQRQPPDPGLVDCPQCEACDDYGNVAGPAPEQRAPIINADILAAPIASMLARIVGGVKPDRSDAADQVTVQMDDEDDDVVDDDGGPCPCRAPAAGPAAAPAAGPAAAPVAGPAAAPTTPVPPPCPPDRDAQEHLLAFGAPQHTIDPVDACDVEEGCLYAMPTQCPRPPTGRGRRRLAVSACACPTEHELDLVGVHRADDGDDGEERGKAPRLIKTPPVFLPGKCGDAKP